MEQKLSTTTSITSTYAGEFAGQYIQAALLASPTLGNGTITVKPNIKYKEVVKKLATSSILAAATCDFTATGTVALTERILTPVEFQVNLQLCKKDFHSDWEAIQMGYSAFDELPRNFSDFLIGNLSQSVGAAVETGIWQHSTNILTGFTLLFKDDATVVDVSGTTITASNVQAELAKVVAAGLALNTTNPVLYVAKDVYYNYLISLGGFGANGLGAAGYDNKGPNQTINSLYFAGVPIIETSGLPTSEMVMAEKENLWFGTGLLNDTNQVKVLDMADLDGSENVRFVMRFTAGVQYGIGAEIVYYWIY